MSNRSTAPAADVAVLPVSTSVGCIDDNNPRWRRFEHSKVTHRPAAQTQLLREAGYWRAGDPAGLRPSLESSFGPSSSF
jgi:hypothetical protein